MMFSYGYTDGVYRSFISTQNLDDGDGVVEDGARSPL